MVNITNKNIHVSMVDVFAVTKRPIASEAVPPAISAAVTWFSLRYSTLSYGWADNVCPLVRPIPWTALSTLSPWPPRLRASTSVRTLSSRISPLPWKLAVTMLRKSALVCWWCMSVWCTTSLRMPGISWPRCMETPSL